MTGQVNPKILGSVVIGVALVGGAFVLSDFGAPPSAAPIEQQAATRQATVPERVPIPVTDEDGNGIEDWRDEFVTTEPIRIDRTASSTYTPPDTVTGQMAQGFFQNLIRARGSGAFGASEEEVIQQTVDTLGQVTAHELYDTPDVTVMEDWEEEDVVTYANTVAGSIMANDRPELGWELEILEDIVRNQNTERLSELEALAEVFQNTRDDVLTTPVPAPLVKEHLDLINTLHAVYKDIEAMTKTTEDPAYALLRLKRYEDDAAGLGHALNNMFQALREYSEYFDAEDTAVLFVTYSPEFQR